MRPAPSLVARLWDPERREELQGDLEELYRRRIRHGVAWAGLRGMWDLASVTWLQSRFRSPPWPSRISALGLATLVALLIAQARSGDPAPPSRYTVQARDGRGAFTLEIDGSRVVGGTLDGEPIAAERLRQAGSRLVIVAGAGDEDFEVEIRPEGGIHWKARRP